MNKKHPRKKAKVRVWTNPNPVPPIRTMTHKEYRESLEVKKKKEWEPFIGKKYLLK